MLGWCFLFEGRVGVTQWFHCIMEDRENDDEDDEEGLMKSKVSGMVHGSLGGSWDQITIFDLVGLSQGAGVVVVSEEV